MLIVTLALYHPCEFSNKKVQEGFAYWTFQRQFVEGMCIPYDLVIQPTHLLEFIDAPMQVTPIVSVYGVRGHCNEA